MILTEKFCFEKRHFFAHSLEKSVIKIFESIDRSGKSIFEIRTLFLFFRTRIKIKKLVFFICAQVKGLTSSPKER